MTSRTSSGSSRAEKRGRAHQIAEHHRDLAALRGVLWQRLRDGWWLSGCNAAKLGDSAQHLLAMAQRNANFFEVLVCQIAQYARINIVFSEAQGVLGET